MPLEANTSLLLHIRLTLQQKKDVPYIVGARIKANLNNWSGFGGLSLALAPCCPSLPTWPLAPGFPCWQDAFHRDKRGKRKHIPQMPASKAKPSELDLNLPAYPRLRHCLCFPADQKKKMKWPEFSLKLISKRRLFSIGNIFFHHNEHPHQQSCQWSFFSPPKFFTNKVPAEKRPYGRQFGLLN